VDAAGHIVDAILQDAGVGEHQLVPVGEHHVLADLLVTERQLTLVLLQLVQPERGLEDAQEDVVESLVAQAWPELVEQFGEGPYPRRVADYDHPARIVKGGVGQRESIRHGVTHHQRALDLEGVQLATQKARQRFEACGTVAAVTVVWQVEGDG
jgi:hypothetical protein